MDLRKEGWKADIVHRRISSEIHKRALSEGEGDTTLISPVRTSSSYDDGGEETRGGAKAYGMLYD